jgi:phage terminase large subunit-like protein
LKACARDARAAGVLARLNPSWLEPCLTDWPLGARPDQLPPGGDWTVWLVLGGRGAGKTRTGAEWIRAIASGPRERGACGRIALVGETHADVREVMVDGVSGLMAVHPRAEKPRYEATRRRLVWPNGAIAQCFSSEEPEALRGPQFDAAWCDEIAKWRDAETAWTNLQFGLRLGRRPREIVTTTPRPTPLLKRLAGDPETAVSRASTFANAFNLAPAFLGSVVKRYAGTRLGRQELDGEIVDERADAFWQRAEIERMRIEPAAPGERRYRRVVVAVDPPAGAGARSCCGIGAAGQLPDGTVHVLADVSMPGVRPEIWAGRAIDLYRDLGADALVAEVNQGGEMVRSVIRSLDPGVPVTMARASAGKRARAEPVAALYAQGRVRHAGQFAALEDEMCLFGADGLAGGRSPDRLDALVWAVSALTERAAPAGVPRVRGL